MRNLLLTFTIALVTLTLSPTMTAAATWYVKADGTGDVVTIQDALDASANGDTVLLAAGTFIGVGNRKLDFKNKQIVLISEDGPTVTIIDCQGLDNGIKIDNGQGSETVVCGITITNGDAGGGDGGGIFINNTSPLIENNIIINCSARHGGGIMAKNGNPTIQNNTFVGNSANNEGGGITAEGGTPFVRNNIIAFNTGGGAFGCRGSGSPFYECNDLFANVGGDSVACGINLGNNISSNPEFCGIPGSGNFFLQSDSPCVPGLSPCGVLIGALGINCGSVSTHQRTWGSMKAMFE